MGTACTLDEARAAKPLAAATFSQLADVRGVGITRVGDGYGLKVNLARTPDRDTDLPESIAGVPVRIEIVGDIQRRG
jgi:hypothetical protein